MPTSSLGDYIGSVAGGALVGGLGPAGIAIGANLVGAGAGKVVGKFAAKATSKQAIKTAI